MDPKDNLLAASRHVFARHGYRRTSMAMVAEEAGVSRQAIYHHFPSKELLFTALVDMLQTRALDAARRAAETLDVHPLAQRLFRVLSAYHSSMVSSVAGSSFASELVEESAKHCSDLVSAHAEKFQRLIVSMVRDEVEGGALSLADGLTERQFVSMLLVAAKGVKLTYAPAGERAHAQALEQMVNALCRGSLIPGERAASSNRIRAVAGRARK